MPLITQLGQSQQAFSQGRVADTSAQDAQAAQLRQRELRGFVSTLSGIGTAFINGAQNRVNTQGIQDALRGQENAFIQDSELLGGLYKQSYNQTQASQKVAQFNDSIPSLYEQGAAEGLEPSEVQRRILDNANKLDDELAGLELNDEFKQHLSGAVAAGYNSIYKIGSEIQAGQAVSNGQTGLATLVGSTLQSLQYSLEAGDAGGARSQLDAAVAAINGSQWLKPTQKQEQIQQLFLNAAANAQSPDAVDFLQQEAERIDPANTALRPRFKQAQAQAGSYVRADLITAQANFDQAPSSATGAALSANIDRSLAAGAITPEDAARQQAELSRGLSTVQRQEQFQTLFSTNGLTVRSAAIQSGIEPDAAIKQVLGNIRDTNSGVAVMNLANQNHDPDLFVGAAKETAKLLSPTLSVLNTFKAGDDVTPEIENSLTQLQQLPVNLRQAVVNELPAETQALYSSMQDRGGISLANLAAGQADIQSSKKLAALPGTAREKREAISKSASNLNGRLYGSSAIVRDSSNEGRIQRVVEQELSSQAAEQWQANGAKGAEVAAARRVRIVPVQEPGVSLNRAFAVTSAPGTTIEDISKTLGLNGHFDNFASQQVQRVKAAYPGQDINSFEIQADGTVRISLNDPDTGIINNLNISAQDVRDQVGVYQKDAAAAEQAFYYRNAAVKPLYANGQSQPVLVAGSKVSSSGLTVQAAQTTNTVIAVLKHEGYSQSAYQDGPNARTEGFGLSTAGGHAVDQNLTEQQNADKATKAIETQYLPRALKAVSAAGIQFPEEQTVLLATDLAYQGFGGAPAVLKAISNGDKAGAISALKATKAYELAGPNSERNKNRLAWIEAAVNNVQGRRNADAVRADVTRVSKY